MVATTPGKTLSGFSFQNLSLKKQNNVEIFNFERDQATLRISKYFDVKFDGAFTGDSSYEKPKITISNLVNHLVPLWPLLYF